MTYSPPYPRVENNIIIPTRTVRSFSSHPLKKKGTYVGNSGKKGKYGFKGCMLEYKHGMRINFRHFFLSKFSCRQRRRGEKKLEMVSRPLLEITLMKSRKIARVIFLNCPDAEFINRTVEITISSKFSNSQLPR